MLRRSLIIIVLLLALVVLIPGCQSSPDLAGRIRGHIAPMKDTYNRGVATYPHETDRAIRIEHWKQLLRLLGDESSGEAK